jgi:hypothetical protein
MAYNPPAVPATEAYVVRLPEMVTTGRVFQVLFICVLPYGPRNGLCEMTFGPGLNKLPRKSAGHGEC